MMSVSAVHAPRPPPLISSKTRPPNESSLYASPPHSFTYVDGVDGRRGV